MSPRASAHAREPNPLLVRELRQALRVARMPWTLAAVVALIGLGMLAAGSVNGTGGAPARLGSGLFQGFIIILLIYVAIVGPATAAGAIASEREGRTLEPLILTALDARAITRGKFLAAYGTLAVHVVALMPLAAIPLLFGGVGAGEIVIAFFFVGAIGAVSVAFGLAVASRAQTLRNALLTAVVVPAVAIMPTLTTLNFVGQSIARQRWPSLPSGPLWWTAAYGSVPFGLDYFVFLILWPLALLGLPTWHYLALTQANLSSQSDDRSSSIKRWLVTASLSIGLLIFLTCFRVAIDSAVVVAAGGIFIGALLALLAASIFVGEPFSPSRRVRARWHREGTGIVARAFGPGLMRGVILQIIALMTVLALSLAGGVFGSMPYGLRAHIGVASSAGERLAVGSALLVVVAYAQLFQLFVLGLSSLLRARTQQDAKIPIARAWTLAAVALASVLPLIAAAIVGTTTSSELVRSVVASPSPLFAIYAAGQEIAGLPDDTHAQVAAIGAAIGWGAIGVTLLVLAADRARRNVAERERVQAKSDDRLRLEDEESDEDPDEDVEAAGGVDERSS